jgi:hypothetical protein
MWYLALLLSDLELELELLVHLVLVEAARRDLTYLGDQVKIGRGDSRPRDIPPLLEEEVERGILIPTDPIREETTNRAPTDQEWNAHREIPRI